jgi:hypothetical protein
VNAKIVHERTHPNFWYGEFIEANQVVAQTRPCATKREAMRLALEVAVANNFAIGPSCVDLAILRP